MGIEARSGRYYEDVYTGQNFLDNYLPIKIALKKYLSALLFKTGDMDRVIYSNASNALRRRMELLGEGLDVSEKFTIAHLDIPFAAFWESKDIQLDKQSASAEFFGAYDLEAATWFKYLQSKRTYTVNIYYDNFEDLRVAHQELNWEMSLGNTANLFCDYIWRGRSIEVPIFVKPISVTSNRAYDTSKLTETYPLYILKVDLEVNTTELLLNRGISAIKLPLKFYTHNDNWESPKDNTIYYTQKSILEFSAVNYGAIIEPEEDVELTEEQKMVDKVCRDVTEDEKAIADAVFQTPNAQMYMVVQGHFDESKSVALNKLKYNESKTTVRDSDGMVTAFVDILVKPATYTYFDHIEVLVPGRPIIRLTDCKLKSFTIDGLYPNSTYRIFVITHSITGEANQVELEFTTPKWKNETLIEDVQAPGTTEQIVVKADPEVAGKPKRISPHALLGTDF